MASPSEAEEGRRSLDSGDPNQAHEIPESQLKRPDPDSILADEANPDDVLGDDNESEIGTKTATQQTNGHHAQPDSNRTSAASAIFSNEQSLDSDSKPSAIAVPTMSDEGRVKTPTLASAGASSGTIAHVSKEEAVQLSPEETTRQLMDQVKDLSNQVTGLNEKLVKSFNRIADLEDDYSDAQERIRSMSAKIAELEKERDQHLDALNTGLLVEKAHVSTEMQRMMDRVIEETAQRGKAESDKSRIEAELDELSSSLFSEANKMVAVERLSRAKAEEKSRNMEERLKDTEGIMVEQQKVLADLQKQVEKLQASSSVVTSGRSADDAASLVSMESDAVSFHRLKTSSLARSLSQRTTMRNLQHRPTGELSAEARLMINIVPYQEYKAFIAHLRKLRRQLAPFYNYPVPGSRESVSASATPRSASPAPQQPLAVTSGSTASSVYSQGISTALSSSSPFVMAGVSRHRDYPHLPSNAETLVHLPNQLSLPFIKRSQEEDVEPCLRLDFAPGLNWLSRRQANTAILEGNLVIEPIFPGGKPIDEEAVRREHAHLPPAACSMCGIPVVNVPLPGGVAATALSAEQGGKTSLMPSSIANATSSWASSAASSLGSITGSSSGSGGSSATSGTLTPKPSRVGLFSSFRRTSNSTKTNETESPAAAQNASAEEADINASTDMLLPAMIPVPTHIFRISEGAPTRYLLCPHHCLARLRAACQFWGFIRNLERSVVLEGKFVSDEIPNASSANASTSDLVNAPVPEKSKDVEALEKAAEESEEAEPPKMNPDDKAKSEAEKVKESVIEAKEIPSSEAEATGTDGIEAREQAKVESQDTREEVGSNKGALDDDDGFADAPSSPTVEITEATAEESDTTTQSEGEKADGDVATAADEGGSQSGSAVVGDAERAGSDKAGTEKAEEDKETKPEGHAEEKQTDTAEHSAVEAPSTDKPLAPPPIPARSVSRSTGAASPAPALPPRRPPRALGGKPADVPVRASTPIVVSTTLQLSKLDSMDWEDKMWTEITKLKEELWRARVGLLTEQDS